jgi:shikimate kinase
MKNNIALIGFMGAGKTVTGRALAAELYMNFIDLDDVIEEKTGKTIPDIFAEQGEPAFRDIETDVLKEACSKQFSVIACGGGIILRKENIDLLNRSALVVYLWAETAALLQRIGGSKGKRPLLDVEDPAAAIDDLLKARRNFYEKTADITVDTTGLTTNSVVRQIISELGNHESFNFEKQHPR